MLEVGGELVTATCPVVWTGGWLPEMLALWLSLPEFLRHLIVISGWLFGFAVAVAWAIASPGSLTFVAATVLGGYFWGYLGGTGPLSTAWGMFLGAMAGVVPAFAAAMLKDWIASAPERAQQRYLERVRSTIGRPPP